MVAFNNCRAVPAPACPDRLLPPAGNPGTQSREHNVTLAAAASASMGAGMALPG